MQISEVFVVHHVHTLEDGEEAEKLIGVYSSRREAEIAIDRLRKQPGFRDTPEGFSFDSYTLNEDHWHDGYVLISPAEMKGMV